MIYENILAFIPMPGPFETIVIAGVALLIFGRKLPDVGRSLGKGIVEFKKGLKGVKEELSDVDEQIEEEVEKERLAELEKHQDIPAEEYTKEA